MSFTIPQRPPSSRIGRRPGPKPRLSAESIVQAAIDTGLGAVTMRVVADRLGVTAPSLYRYFESRDGIVLAALQTLLARAPAPDASVGWRAVLDDEARLQWELLAQCPGLVADSPERLARATNARTNALVEALTDDGIAVDDAVLVVDAVLDVVHDGVAQASRLRAPDDHDAVAPDLAARLTDTPAPIRAALERIVDDPAAHVYRKVALLLDGFAVRLLGSDVAR